MDASLLSDLAWQAKKHWGYPDEWMALWQEDLMVSPEMIETHQVWKAICKEEIAGFIIITDLGDGFEIEHCFVKPTFIGKGCGKALVRHVMDQADYQGARFTVLSDPNAVAFYEKFGFETYEHIPSKPEGRSLPLMRMVNS